MSPENTLRTPRIPDASEVAQEHRNAFEAAVLARRTSGPSPTNPLASTDTTPRITTLRAKE